MLGLLKSQILKTTHEGKRSINCIFFDLVGGFMKWLLYLTALCVIFSFTLVAQWIQTNGPYGGYVQALAINSSGHIFAGTYYGGVYPSDGERDGNNGC